MKRKPSVIAIFHSIGMGEYFEVKNNGNTHQVSYDWFRSGDVIKYIAREDAVLVQEDNLNADKLNHIFLKSGKSENDFMRDFLKKYSNNNKLSGIYEFTKDAKDVPISKAQSNLRRLSNNQKIFSLIFSPKAELVYENRFFSKKQWVEILREEVKLLCKKNNIDPDNIKGYMGIHTNTDTPHAHLVFYETKPSFYNQQTKMREWYPKNTFSYRTLSEFKQNTQRKIDLKFYKTYESSLLRSKGSLYELKKSFKDDINALTLNFPNLAIQRKISQVANYCTTRKISSYSKIKDNTIKTYLKDINSEIQKEHIIYRDLNYKYDKFINSLKDIEAYDSFALKELNQLYKREVKEREAKIYNFVLNTCLKIDKDYKMKQSPYERYLSSFYTHNQINWKEEVYLPNLKDLNNFIENRKVQLADELDISFTSELEDFVEANQIDTKQMKEFKRAYGSLRGILSKEKLSLSEIVEMEQTKVILNYLSKYNDDFAKFEREYELMLKDFEKQIMKIEDYDVKEKGYRMEKKFIEDIQKAKALVVISKMDLERGQEHLLPKYNLNVMWKERQKQAKAIQDFYKQFGVDVEDMVDYVMENSW